jgi:hypothetical protein
LRKQLRERSVDPALQHKLGDLAGQTLDKL